MKLNQTYVEDNFIVHESQGRISSLECRETMTYAVLLKHLTEIVRVYGDEEVICIAPDGYHCCNLDFWFDSEGKIFLIG